MKYSQKLKFRPFIQTDTEACLLAMKSNVPRYFASEEVVLFEQFLGTCDQEKHQLSPYYVVLLGDQLIGCGGFGMKDQGDYLVLTWGLIHADFHKMAYGKALLNYRLEQFKKLYPEKTMYLDTTQHAAGFFEKYGFQTTKITPDFYAKGMDRYDMTLMR